MKTLTREIEPDLLDHVGMIGNKNSSLPDNGDNIAKTVEYAITYNKIGLLIRIFNVLNKEYGLYWMLYRSIYHRWKGNYNISRDHIFKMKIGSLYFKSKLFKYYFDSLPVPFKKFNNGNCFLTPDLWLFVKDKYLLWEVSLLIYIPAILWSKFIRFIGDIKPVSWQKFKALGYLYDKNGKVDTFFNGIRRLSEKSNREYIKSIGWRSCWLYFCARCIPKLPQYTLNQTALALFVLRYKLGKSYWITPLIEKALFSYTWKDNPELRLLLNQGKAVTKEELDKFPIYNSKITSRMPDEMNDYPLYKISKLDKYKYRINVDIIRRILKIKNH